MFLPLRCRVIILAHCAGASLGSFHFDVIVHYIAGMLYLLLVIFCREVYLSGQMPSIEMELCSIFQRIPFFFPLK